MWWLILIVNLMQCRVICIKESPSEGLSRSGQPVCLSIGNCLHDINRGGTTCLLWLELLPGFVSWTVSEERGVPTACVCALLYAPNCGYDVTSSCLGLPTMMYWDLEQQVGWNLSPLTFLSKIFYSSNKNETRTLATKSFHLAELQSWV